MIHRGRPFGNLPCTTNIAARTRLSSSDLLQRVRVARKGRQLHRNASAAAAASASETAAGGAAGAASPTPGRVWRQIWHRLGARGGGFALGAVTAALVCVYGVSDESFARLRGHLSHLDHPGQSTLVPYFTSGRAPRYGSRSEMHKAIKELRQTFGNDAISTDDDDLRVHGYSEWSTINVEQLPVAVAYPKSTEEVSQIARVCYKHRVPMVPFAGGTSLEANFAAPYGGISIDFAFMDQIVEFHPDDMDVVVQPAVSWMSLNDEIESSGLFFPVDPAPSAKIGGMVGTSCSGTNAVRYGTMKDWVINLTVVLADGTVMKTRQRPRKSAAGYNLTSLFVGSEGTLGLVTEATLKLTTIPEETSVAVVTFPTIRDAAAASSKIMRAGIPVAAMELMDEVQMRVINLAGTTAKTWKEVPTMFFKFSGTAAGVRENIQRVKNIANQNKGGHFEFALTPEEKKRLWSARKESLWSTIAVKGEGMEVYSTDVAVPLSRLPDLIEVSKRELDSLGLFASVLGHVGDGNFHESILYDSKDPAQRHAVHKCVYDMVDRALEMEGTCTGEHGVGLGKKKSLAKEVGPHTIGAMKSIKGALDPRWLMNPGKVIDLPA